jgi:hypothetical protein
LAVGFISSSLCKVFVEGLQRLCFNPTNFPERVKKGSRTSKKNGLLRSLFEKCNPINPGRPHAGMLVRQSLRHFPNSLERVYFKYFFCQEIFWPWRRISFRQGVGFTDEPNRLKFWLWRSDTDSKGSFCRSQPVIKSERDRTWGQKTETSPFRKGEQGSRDKASLFKNGTEERIHPPALYGVQMGLKG